jgi:hypothetical protein
MSKLSFTLTIFLLSSVWMVAQVSNPPTDQNPTGSSQSAQQPDKSQTASKDKSAQAVEGCLSGAANVFTLTDAKGKTYELMGDTSMLNDNVGHKVRLWGHADTSGGGAKISAAGPQALFDVKKVETLSPTCK